MAATACCPFCDLGRPAGGLPSPSSAHPFFLAQPLPPFKSLPCAAHLHVARMAPLVCALWSPDPAQMAAALLLLLGTRQSSWPRWMGSCWLGASWHGIGRKRGSFRDPFCGRFCNPILHPMSPRSDSCPREMLLAVGRVLSRAGAMTCMSVAWSLDCAAGQALLWDGGTALPVCLTIPRHVPRPGSM